MNIIVCLDDNNGMMFNQRRQSRDRILTEKVLEICGNSRLLMNSYSSKLFVDAQNITLSENFLEEGVKGDFCFCETEIKTLENAEEIYIFRWNRIYPADVYFNFDLEKEGFVICSTEEFKGSSHDNITLNIYRRA